MPQSPYPHSFSRKLTRRLFNLDLLCCFAAIFSIALQVSGQDTLSRKIMPDTTGVASQHIDSSKKFDSARGSSPAKASDTTKDSLKTGVNFDSCMIIGAGIGLSVGSIPVFSIWKNGLPQSLAGFGISSSSLGQPADSVPLAFFLKENPDIYNMVFPLSISFDRCFSQSRLGTALSFSLISKNYTSSIATAADSSLRRIDIRQQLSLYTLTLDLLYGRKIPARYFSVDGVDRTDAIIGISIAPLLALNKRSSIKSNTSDPRFTSLADSLAKGANSFSSYGVAFGWRAGIMTLRRLSNQGGVEAGISYFGAWSGRFRTGEVPLLERQISNTGAEGKEISSISHRIELSVSLVRKVFL
jgi:hypothetical protein